MSRTMQYGRRFDDSVSSILSSFLSGTHEGHVVKIILLNCASPAFSVLSLCHCLAFMSCPLVCVIEQDSLEDIDVAGLGVTFCLQLH
jgi:hypothetical protein